MSLDPQDFKISCPCYHTGKVVRIGDKCVAIFDFKNTDISGGPPHRPRHVVVSKDFIKLVSVSDDYIAIAVPPLPLTNEITLHKTHYVEWREVKAFASGPRDPHQN